MDAFIGYIKRVCFIGNPCWDSDDNVGEDYAATDYDTGELKYPGVIINFSGNKYFLEDSVAMESVTHMGENVTYMGDMVTHGA